MLDAASKARMLKAVQLVRTGTNFAIDLDQDPMQFAVQISEMYREGLQDSELRWLVLRGYMRHLTETTEPRDQLRTFDATARLFFGPRSSFTPEVEIAPDEALRQITGMTLKASSCESTIGTANGKLIAPCRTTPTWNPVRRELWIGETLVKDFKWRAPNQELVLTVFEEESWPDRILDPLPVTHNKCPGRRLNDTIKCLNKRQESRLIKFRGDGTGQGVLWEFAPEASGLIPPPSVRSPTALAEILLGE